MKRFKFHLWTQVTFIAIISKTFSATVLKLKFFFTLTEPFFMYDLASKNSNKAGPETHDFFT